MGSKPTQNSPAAPNITHNEGIPWKRVSANAIFLGQLVRQSYGFPVEYRIVIEGQKD